jgi:hypothetical protein
MKKNKRILIFITPVLAILFCALCYAFFIASFKGYDATSTRFLKSMDLYAAMPQGSTLFLGDSQIRQAIDCRKIEEAVPVTCYNMGIESMSSLQLAMLHETIINAKPRQVIIGVSPLFFSEGLNNNSDLYFFMGEQGIVVDSGLSAEVHPSEKKLLTMNKISRSLYKRRYILPHYQHVLLSRSPNASQTPTPQSQEFKDSFLYTIPQTELELQEKLANPQLVSLFYFNNSIPRQRAALAFLVEDLVRSNITVTVIAMPLYPALASTLPQESLTAYHSFLQNTSVEMNASFVDWSSGFPQEDFIDLTHLNERGRDAFIEKLKNEHVLISTSLPEVSLNNMSIERGWSP